MIQFSVPYFRQSMAPKNMKDLGTRAQTRARTGKAIGKVNQDAESSEEDYRKKRDKNNQVRNFYSSMI